MTLQQVARDMGITEHQLLTKLAEELQIPNPQGAASVWSTRIAVGDIPQRVQQFLLDVSKPVC